MFTTGRGDQTLTGADVPQPRGTSFHCTGVAGNCCAMRWSPASSTGLRLLALFHVIGRASTFTLGASRTRERGGVFGATAVGMPCSGTTAAALSYCRGRRPFHHRERGTRLFMQRSYRDESEVREDHLLCASMGRFNVCRATCCWVERRLRTLLSLSLPVHQ